MVYIVKKVFGTGFLIYLQVLLLCPANHQVAAEECRKTLTVLVSTQNVDINAVKGGHLWKHIGGITARPPMANEGDTQLNQPLFYSWDGVHTGWDAFEYVWNTFVKLNIKTAQCAVNKINDQTAVDCINADRINAHYTPNGFYCTHVNKDKICTYGHSFTIKSYLFVYKVVNKEWIMLTAIPQVSTCH